MASGFRSPNLADFCFYMKMRFSHLVSLIIRYGTARPRVKDDFESQLPGTVPM